VSILKSRIIPRTAKTHLESTDAKEALAQEVNVRVTTSARICLCDDDTSATDLNQAGKHALHSKIKLCCSLLIPAVSLAMRHHVHAAAFGVWHGNWKH